MTFNVPPETYFIHCGSIIAYSPRKDAAIYAECVCQQGEPMLSISDRPRRNRKHPWIRSMMRETTLSVDHLILPLFIFDGEGRQPIASMPGQARLGRAALLRRSWRCKAKMALVPLFCSPQKKETPKTPDGVRAYNPNGLVPESIRAIKSSIPRYDHCYGRCS